MGPSLIGYCCKTYIAIPTNNSLTHQYFRAELSLCSINRQLCLPCYKFYSLINTSIYSPCPRFGTLGCSMFLYARL